MIFIPRWDNLNLEINIPAFISEVRLFFMFEGICYLISRDVRSLSTTSSKTQKNFMLKIGHRLTTNSEQCYLAAWRGGKFGGEWIHVYRWLHPFAVHLKLLQHCWLATAQYKIKFKKMGKIQKTQRAIWKTHTCSKCNAHSAHSLTSTATHVSSGSAEISKAQTRDADSVTLVFTVCFGVWVREVILWGSHNLRSSISI